MQEQLLDQHSVASPESMARLFERHRFRYYSERDLQDAMEKVLVAHGIACKRESALSRADRPDFMVGTTAIEVKIQGSLAELLRQINRYAQHDDVESILVVGTPHWISRIPPDLAGKAIYRVRLVGSLL